MVDLVRVDSDVQFEPRCAVCGGRVSSLAEGLLGYVPGSLVNQKVLGLFHTRCVVTEHAGYPRFTGLKTSSRWSCGIGDCRSGGSHWDRDSAQKCIDRSVSSGS